MNFIRSNRSPPTDPGLRACDDGANKHFKEIQMKFTQPIKAIFVGALILTTAGCSTDPSDRRMSVALGDTAISAKIKAALLADPDVKGTDVQVETYRGTVQLSGFVASPQNASRAVDIARRVEGVAEVKNALIVK